MFPTHPLTHVSVRVFFRRPLTETETANNKQQTANSTRHKRDKSTRQLDHNHGHGPLRNVQRTTTATETQEYERENHLIKHAPTKPQSSQEPSSKKAWELETSQQGTPNGQLPMAGGWPITANGPMQYSWLWLAFTWHLHLPPATCKLKLQIQTRWVLVLRVPEYHFSACWPWRRQWR